MGVSIIPGERTSWDVIGRMIGESLNRTLPGAVERGYERGLIQNGLNEVKNLTPEQLKDMQPHQLIAHILGPFAGTRQGAQYAEAILPSITKLINRNQLFQNAPGEPSSRRPDREPVQSNYDPNLIRDVPFGGNGIDAAKNMQMQKMAGEGAFQYEAPGQGRPQVQSESTEAPTLPLGSVDVQDMLRYAANSADPFEYIRFYADTNKLAKEQREELFNEYTRNYEKDSNRLARENAFRTFAEDATTDKKYSNDDFNRLIRYSDKYMSEPSQTRRLYHAERDLQKYNNAIHSLEHARKAPGFFENLFRGQEQATKQLQSAVRPLVELGELDKAKELVSGLGFGPLQTEKVVNPLKKEAQGMLQRVKQAPSSAPRTPGAGRQGEGVQRAKIRKAELDKLPEVITNAVKAGGEFASLKLIRDNLFKKGYLEHEFSAGLDEAIANGLKLSDYQRTEQAELGRAQRRPLMDIFFSKEPGEVFTELPQRGEELMRTFRGYE